MVIRRTGRAWARMGAEPTGPSSDPVAHSATNADLDECGLSRRCGGRARLRGDLRTVTGVAGGPVGALWTAMEPAPARVRLATGDHVRGRRGLGGSADVVVGSGPARHHRDEEWSRPRDRPGLLQKAPAGGPSSERSSSRSVTPCLLTRPVGGRYPASMARHKTLAGSTGPLLGRFAALYLLAVQTGVCVAASAV